MRPRRLASFLLVAALPARATMMVPLDLQGLVDRAERIVHARVETQVARWTASHDAIYTEVTLRVLQPVKGAMRAGDVVTLRREGGVVDGIGMRVQGAAVFEAGEEVVVFLERRGAALWTVAMAQGKMRVAEAQGR